MVSFHSLEDRIVKRFLKTRSQYAARPSRHRPDFGAPAPTFELLSRKAILPIEEERIKNSRARSAKLRIARRTDASKLTESQYSEASQTLPSRLSFDHETSSTLEAQLCG